MHIGESAGAIAVSPNIEYASAMDSVKKAPDPGNFDGLNIADFSIVPHHTNAPVRTADDR